MQDLMSYVNKGITITCQLHQFCSLRVVCNFAGVKAPIAILGAEIDHRAPLELLKQFEEILAAKSEVRLR